MVFATLLLVAIAAWWQVYRYHDCKAVGHQTLYCIGSIGK